MRKPAVYICENKGADQLHGNPLKIVCVCTVWFVLDQVRNPKDWFSRNTAQLTVQYGSSLFNTHI